MKNLRVLFAFMLATAAVVPLLTYGAVSVYTMRTGTRRTVVEGNSNVAGQVAEQVRRYISTNLQIFQALAVDVEGIGLTRRAAGPHPEELRPAVPGVPRTDPLRLGRPAGGVEPGRKGICPALPRTATATVMGVTMTPVTIDDDLCRRRSWRCRSAGATSPRAGWSGSSASRNSGAWWTASASAGRVSRSWSAPAVNCWRTGTPTKGRASRAARTSPAIPSCRDCSAAAKARPSRVTCEAPTGRTGCRSACGSPNSTGSSSIEQPYSRGVCAARPGRRRN